MSKVAERSDEAQEMLEKAADGRALMGGTKEMREAGKTYLPKFEAEEEVDYQARLKLSWLFNGYRKTVRDMVGRIFQKPVEPGDGIPDDMLAWLDNVDMQGRDLSAFARDLAEDAISGCGIAYIMVDAPPRQGTVTQAQAQAEGLRPYFVHLSAEDILGWRTMLAGNATVLGQLRILEEVTEPDPEDEFGEIEYEQVRVLDRLPQGVQVRLFRKIKEGDTQTWVMWGEPFMTGLSDITVVPFYANRCEFFEGEPLLDDLAAVNIAHWQSQSDQRNILHAARVPLLVASGFSAEDKVVISANKVTLSSNPDAKMAWVEHSGQAIGAGRQDLKDLEFQMETFGLQLLVAQNAQSATGEALDAAKETSQLAMIADNLKDALEQALIYMAQYGGKGEIDPTVTVNKEFGVSLMGAQEMNAMLSAVNTGALSRETFLREMARRGMIAPDTNVDDEMERIADEGGGMNATVSQ